MICQIASRLQESVLVQYMGDTLTPFRPASTAGAVKVSEARFLRKPDLLIRNFPPHFVYKPRSPFDPTSGILPFLGLPRAEELLRCEIAQSLMRVDGIIDLLPPLKFSVQGVKLKGKLRHFVELLRMGPLSPLHTAIKLRRSRRQHTESLILRF